MQRTISTSILNIADQQKIISAVRKDLLALLKEYHFLQPTSEHAYYLKGKIVRMRNELTKLAARDGYFQEENLTILRKYRKLLDNFNQKRLMPVLVLQPSYDTAQVSILTNAVKQFSESNAA